MQAGKIHRTAPPYHPPVSSCVFDVLPRFSVRAGSGAFLRPGAAGERGIVRDEWQQLRCLTSPFLRIRAQYAENLKKIRAYMPWMG